MCTERDQTTACFMAVSRVKTWKSLKNKHDMLCFISSISDIHRGTKHQCHIQDSRYPLCPQMSEKVDNLPRQGRLVELDILPESSNLGESTRNGWGICHGSLPRIQPFTVILKPLAMCPNWEIEYLMSRHHSRSSRVWTFALTVFSLYRRGYYWIELWRETKRTSFTTTLKANISCCLKKLWIEQ